MTEEEFSKVIRNHVVAVGETQLADHLHVSTDAIRRWSQGKNLPYQGGIKFRDIIAAYVIRTFLLDMLAYHGSSAHE